MDLILIKCTYWKEKQLMSVDADVCEHVCAYLFVHACVQKANENGYLNHPKKVEESGPGM